MKKLVALTIFSSVLTFAALSHAATQVSLPIEKASYNTHSRVLRVAGFLPNPCINGTRLALTPTKMDKVLVLDVIGQQAASVCIAMIGGTFDLNVNIMSLKSELAELGLDENVKYLVTTRDGSFSAVIDFGEPVLSIPENGQNYGGGVLTVENNGHPVAVVSEEDMFNRN